MNMTGRTWYGMEIETRNLVAGRWEGGKTTAANVNPSDLSDVIGMHAQASAAQLDASVEAARRAQRAWWDAGIQKRHDVLMTIGTELMARSAEIGALVSREEGKPLAEGKGEVYRAGQFFTYFAAEALRQIGDHAQSVRPGIEIDVRREPVGVVAVVSPWNFPVATPAWKIAPAFAFGNAVVWKPASLTPASAAAMAAVIARQDIPEGLFSMLAGPGGEIGQRLVEHPGVDAISFTGSVPVGRGVAAAATRTMTKVQLEMGSKNPIIVMDDADLDPAVSHCAGAAFGGTGQKCTAASRLIVHERVHDGVFQHGVDVIQHPPVGAIRLVTKSLFRQICQRRPPLLLKVGDVGRRIHLNRLQWRHRPDGRVGQFDLLRHPDHIATSGTQNVMQQRFQ